MSIVSDSINEKSAGKMLADARFYRNFSLDKVAKELRIDSMLLYKVEVDNFSDFEDIPNAIAFIDKLCEFYQTDSYPIIETYSINCQKMPGNVKITDTVLDLKIQPFLDVEKKDENRSEENIDNSNDKSMPIEELQPSSKVDAIFLNLDLFNEEAENAEEISAKIIEETINENKMDAKELKMPKAINIPEKVYSITKDENNDTKKMTVLNGTFGEILKNGRIAKKYSILTIAEITRIPHSYIDFFENDNFDRFPAPVYTKSYIKKLSEKYELDISQLLNLYENRNCKSDENPAKEDDSHGIKKNQKIYLNSSFLPPMSNVRVKRNPVNNVLKFGIAILVLIVMIFIIKDRNDSFIDDAQVKDSSIQNVEKSKNSKQEHKELETLITLRDLSKFVEKPTAIPQKMKMPQTQ